MTTRYYLKEKCKCECHIELNFNGHSNACCHSQYLHNGKCKGFVRGADVTELMNKQIDIICAVDRLIKIYGFKIDLDKPVESLLSLFENNVWKNFIEVVEE